MDVLNLNSLMYKITNQCLNIRKTILSGTSAYIWLGELNTYIIIQKGQEDIL